MRIRCWGTRGSVAAPGQDKVRYGGETTCYQVCTASGSMLILDAGTGLRALGKTLGSHAGRIDILLTHLHMDHIQGLGFFAPLYQPDVEVHLWGPQGTTLRLHQRLSRYLSPPIFPTYLRDMPAPIHYHELADDEVAIGEFVVTSALVCHPTVTLGYRIETGDGALGFIPDHEPALGWGAVPFEDRWTSGYALARDADLLIHDAQFTSDQYQECVGWGHSSLDQALQFARLCRVRHLVPCHHDPGRSDDELDRFFANASATGTPMTPARDGLELGITQGVTKEVAEAAAQDPWCGNL